MSTQKKSKPDLTTTAAARVEAETHDEIEQIMSEIKELTDKIEEAPKMAPAPKLRSVKSEAAPEPAEEDLLNEFHGSGNEPSMEETLGDLREEGPSGPSLLDDVISEAAGSDESAMEEAVGADEEARHEEEESFEPVPAGKVYVEDKLRLSTHSEEESQMFSDKKDENGETGQGSLTLTVSGNMSLKLKFDCEGQEVTLGFADNALKIQLADGTEFKVPVRRGKTNLKRVA